MAAKPATLFLQFPKQGGREGLWTAMLNDIPNAQVHDFGPDHFASLPVQSFSLEDHQFVRVHFKRKNGGETQCWIPRAIVSTIVEGKADTSAFHFVRASEKSSDPKAQTL